jgi:hypothetical protein
VRGTVLLVRHPCATVESQLRSTVHGYPGHRAGFPPADHVQDRALQALGPEVPAEVRSRIRQVDSRAGLLALSWAVDTAIPLADAAPARTTILYEDLVTDGPGQLGQLFADLSAPVPDEALAVLGAPSRASDDEADPEGYLDRWTDALDPDTVERVLTIVSWFGLDRIYSRELTPTGDQAGVDPPAWIGSGSDRAER